MNQKRLEQEIECMLKYVKTLEDAKDLLAHKERLLARVLDDNKWLERDYYEIEEENENLKQRLIEKDARIEELEGQFAYECECNKQFVECQRENEELKQQLKNAIVPKFKIGQEVYYLDRYGVQKDIIVSFTYFSIENEILYKMHDEIIDHREKYIFATKEEAQVKLEELEGEK